MTKLKICGLTRLEDIEAVNRFLPDYIGFVFADSRRRVTPEQALVLKERLDHRIKAVGVFVNAPVSFIAELWRAGIIDLVQLHGDEDEAYINTLKGKITCPIIKAVRVQSSGQILEAQKLPCDMLLLDSYQEGSQGGSGIAFDRTLIPCLKKEFFLAGGLAKHNVVQAIQECGPFGLDISSGVESEGKKDPVKIQELITRIREIK